MRLLIVASPGTDTDSLKGLVGPSHGPDHGGDTDECPGDVRLCAPEASTKHCE